MQNVSHSPIDYSKSSLAHSDEISFKPGIILDCFKAGELATRHVDQAVMHVWVLGRRVVAPDDHIFHMGGRNATTHCHLQEQRAKSGFAISSDKELTTWQLKVRVQIVKKRVNRTTSTNRSVREST